MIPPLPILTLLTAVTIESFCAPDCPDYGYAGSWDAVVDAAIQSPTCNTPKGCTLEFGAADYGFNDTIHVGCPVQLQGAGVTRTRLFVGTAKNGVVFHFNIGPGTDPDMHPPYSTTCLTSGGGGVDALTIRARPIGTVSSTTTAVKTWASVSVTNVILEAFGHGLGIRACYISTGGNANVMRVENVNVQTMAGWGVYNEGCDANASVFSSVNVNNVCMSAGYFDANNFTCWGIRDRAPFNNTWVAPHVALVCDTTIGCSTTGSHHPGYIIGAPGSTSSSTLISPYVEATERPAYLYAGSIAIGGSDTFYNLLAGTGAGVHWRRGWLNGQVRAVNRIAPQIDVLLGDYAAGVALGMEVNGQSSSNERLTWDPTTNTWAWKAGGGGAGGLGITAGGARSTTNTTMLSGRAWLGRNGEFYEGRVNVVAARITGYATDPTAALGTGYPAGSTYTNLRARRGDAYMWVLVCDGAQIPDAAGNCGTQAKLWDIIQTAGSQ